MMYRQFGNRDQELFLRGNSYSHPEVTSHSCLNTLAGVDDYHLCHTFTFRYISRTWWSANIEANHGLSRQEQIYKCGTHLQSEQGQTGERDTFGGHKRKPFPPDLSKQRGFCFALRLQSSAPAFVCLIMQTQNESRVNSSTFRVLPARVACKECLLAFFVPPYCSSAFCRSAAPERFSSRPWHGRIGEVHLVVNNGWSCCK